MSERDSWNDPQSEAPVPAKKKGMSGCMLATLIVGGLGAVGMLVCCGGGAFLFSMFIPTVTKEPAEVTAVGRQILDKNILEGFSPDQATTIDNMLFTLRIAEFKQKEGKGEMMMGCIKVKIGDPQQANMQAQQFRTAFEQKIKGSLNVKNTETHEITVNGKKVTVSVDEAIDQVTQKALHTATADFQQGTGETFMMLRMDDDVWNLDAVLNMLSDTKVDHSNDEEMKPDDAGPENAKPDDAKPDDAKPDDAKPDDAKPDDAKPEETKAP